MADVRIKCEWANEMELTYFAEAPLRSKREGETFHVSEAWNSKQRTLTDTRPDQVKVKVKVKVCLGVLGDGEQEWGESWVGNDGGRMHGGEGAAWPLHRKQTWRQNATLKKGAGHQTGVGNEGRVQSRYLIFLLFLLQNKQKCSKVMSVMTLASGCYANQKAEDRASFG